MDVRLTIRYHHKEGRFECVEERTNLKPEFHEEVICDFLRTQIGTGSDSSPVAERDVYEISVACNLDGDTFSIQHDCGNMELRDGILMGYVGTLNADNAEGLARALAWAESHTM